MTIIFVGGSFGPLLATVTCDRDGFPFAAATGLIGLLAYLLTRRAAA